jgi:hypothetical protein
METLLGDKSEFAIQVMSEPDLKPPSAVWGRMCLWVKGIQLGDFNNSHCGLCQCVHHLNQVLEILDELWSNSFNNKSDKEIFNFLKTAWLDPGFDDFGASNECSQYHKYNASYGFAEMFDSEGMFFILTMPNNILKFLYQPNESSDIKSLAIDKELFTNTVIKFNSWYVEQENILETKNA